MANLVTTIESVAAGDSSGDHETRLVTTDMLEGAVLHLAGGQSINVMQMAGSLEDAINVIQVETSDLVDHVSTIEEMCVLDIESEEQKHILSETGAHVIVNTENEVLESAHLTELCHQTIQNPSVLLPSVPFSFPGQTFDIKCQKLILNVWDFFKRLKKNPDILDEIRTPQERAAAALHISAATIGKIGKHFRATGKLQTPGKKRKRAKPIVDSVNAEHEQIIRRIIKEYKNNRVTPTIPMILSEVRERINFQGGSTSFRRILQRMGYKGLTAKLATNSFTPKLKSVSTSTSTMVSTKSSQKKRKVVNIDNSFLSIPVTTPVSSPTKAVAFSSVVPSLNSSASLSAKMESSFKTTNLSSQLVSNLLGGSILQLEASPKAEQFTISQQTAAAIASATSRVDEGPQTIHVLQPDNTVQQIQIVYASIT